MASTRVLDFKPSTSVASPRLERSSLSSCLADDPFAWETCHNGNQDVLRTKEGAADSTRTRCYCRRPHRASRPLPKAIGRSACMVIWVGMPRYKRLWRSLAFTTPVEVDAPVPHSTHVSHRGREGVPCIRACIDRLLLAQ